MKRVILFLLLLCTPAFAQTEKEFFDLVKEHLDNTDKKHIAKRLEAEQLAKELKGITDEVVFDAKAAAIEALEQEIDELNMTEQDWWLQTDNTCRKKYGKPLINLMTKFDPKFPLPDGLDLFVGALFFRQTLCEDGFPAAVASLAWDAAVPMAYEFAAYTMAGVYTKLATIPFELDAIQAEHDAWVTRYNEVMSGMRCANPPTLHTRVDVSGAVSELEDGLQRLHERPYYNGKAQHAAEISFMIQYLREAQTEVDEGDRHRYHGGDINSDDKVDFEDFLRFQQNFGMESGATWEDGDFNYDGDVDFGDFLDLSENYYDPDNPLGNP